MSRKFPILFALLVSLFTMPFAQRETARAITAKAPGCEVMTCVNGCCAVMPCCEKGSTRQEPQPGPAPVRVEFQWAATDDCFFPFLYALPKAKGAFVILDEATVGHALPPRVTSCIQLI